MIRTTLQPEESTAKPETRTILAQVRHIRDYDTEAATKFPEAAEIVRRVSRRVSERYERSRACS